MTFYDLLRLSSCYRCNMKTFNASLTTFCVLYFVPVFKDLPEATARFCNLRFFRRFAKNVADEFTLVPTDDFFELDLRYDFGQALYVGWATMATGIISSSVLILTSLKFRQRENYNSSGQLPSSRFKTDYELAETPLVRSKVSTKRSQNTTLTDAIQRQAKTYNCSTSILNPALSESRVCSCGPVKSNCCVAKKTYVWKILSKHSPAEWYCMSIASMILFFFCIMWACVLHTLNSAKLPNNEWEICAEFLRRILFWSVWQCSGM